MMGLLNCPSLNSRTKLQRPPGNQHLYTHSAHRPGLRTSQSGALPGVLPFRQRVQLWFSAAECSQLSQLYTALILMPDESFQDQRDRNR